MAQWTPSNNRIGAASGSNPYSFGYSIHPIPAGSLLVAFVAWSSASGSVVDFGDTINGSNSWTYVPGSLIQANGFSLAAYYFNGSAAASLMSVEVQLSAAQSAVLLALYAFTGPSALVDVAGTNSGNSSAPTSGNITPNHVADLILGAVIGPAISGGESGWIEQVSSGQFATEYIQPGSVAPLAATFATSFAGGYIANIISFYSTHVDAGAVSATEDSGASASPSTVIDAGSISSHEQSSAHATSDVGTVRDAGAISAHEQSSATAGITAIKDFGAISASEQSSDSATFVAVRNPTVQPQLNLNELTPFTITVSDPYPWSQVVGIEIVPLRAAVI